MRESPTFCCLTRLLLLGLASAAWPALAHAGDGGLEVLSDAAAYRRVCDAVRTEGSVRFEGDEVARGRARAEYKRHRDEVLQSVYSADIPPSGYVFNEYDYDAKRLPVDFNKTLRPYDGVDLTALIGEVGDLDFAISPEGARAVSAARKDGRAALRVTFGLATSAQLADPCVRIGGGRQLRIRIDPLALEVVTEGSARPLARVESPRYRHVVTEAPAAGRPRVQVGATAELDPQLGKMLETQVLGCYKAGLTRNARMRGSVVVAVGPPEKEGKPEWVRAEIDAVGDAALVACVLERFRGMHFGKTKTPLSVPVYFQGGD
jgi:hypothetical protein